MDPYRQGPYPPYRPQYSAPPQQYSQPPPRGMPYGAPQPYRGGPPPGRGGYVGQPLGARPPPALGQQVVVDAEKLTTLFIGNIPPGIGDAWMEKVLKTCGTLNKWKRVKDQSGNLQKFGFAEYADPEGVLRALRVIGGEGAMETLMFPALDGSGVTKKLIVKADDATRTYLTQHEETRPKTVHDEELDKTAWKSAKDYITDMQNSPDPAAQSPGTSSHPDPHGAASPKLGEPPHDEESDLPPDLPPEQKEIITKEIAFFRERAAQRERERKRGEEDRQRAKEYAEQERMRAAEKERERERERDQQRFQPAQDRDARAIQAFVRERRESVELEDEEGERRRQEQRMREQENGFREREKRWEQRESSRMRGYQRDMQRDKEMEERDAKTREDWAVKLAEFNDDAEAERGEHEYYRDRALWAHTRSITRQREKDQDDRDRAREQEEIEEARRQEMREREREQQQQQQQRAANGETGTGRGDVDATSNGVDASMAVQPLASATDQTPTARRGKFNFNLALKRRAPTVSKSGTPEEDEDDEENAERKKRRVLVPLNYDDDDLKGVGEKTAALLVTQEVSAEERRRLVTELVDEIRAAQDGVWKWNVKWDELDETILTTKLLPFVAKQIVDLLGVQEDELTSFVMDHVRNRRTPEELVTELEMALDEEAPNFVMKLWRRLIFETESKHRKL